MAQTRGSTKRLIQTPGYHIQPEYDLTYLRKRRKGDDGSRDFEVALPLTSMIDMFSMLVIFLLLNFSATGEAFFVNKDVTLPEAIHARPLETLPLVSLTKDTITLDAAPVGSNPVTLTESNWDMPEFVRALRQLKSMQENLQDAGLETKGLRVNLQADQNTSVLYIKRVMNVLVSEGFSGVNFAVRELHEDAAP